MLPRPTVENEDIILGFSEDSHALQNIPAESLQSDAILEEYTVDIENT